MARISCTPPPPPATLSKQFGQGGADVDTKGKLEQRKDSARIEGGAEVKVKGDVTGIGGVAGNVSLHGAVTAEANVIAGTDSRKLTREEFADMFNADANVNLGPSSANEQLLISATVVGTGKAAMDVDVAAELEAAAKIIHAEQNAVGSSGSGTPADLKRA